MDQLLFEIRNTFKCSIENCSNFAKMVGIILKKCDIFTIQFCFLTLSDCKNFLMMFTGDLERLRRYWMTGTCKPGKHQHKSSDPLAMEQFLSAFVLLMFGILIAFALLGFESGYFKYARKRMYKKRKKPCCCGCCRLISVVCIQNCGFLSQICTYVNSRTRIGKYRIFVYILEHSRINSDFHVWYSLIF